MKLALACDSEVVTPSIADTLHFTLSRRFVFVKRESDGNCVCGTWIGSVFLSLFPEHGTMLKLCS